MGVGWVWGLGSGGVLVLVLIGVLVAGLFAVRLCDDVYAL